MSNQGTNQTQTAVPSVNNNNSQIGVLEQSLEEPISTNPFDSMEGETALEAIRPFLGRIPPGEIRRLTVSPQTLVRVGLIYARLYGEDRYIFEKYFSKEVFDAAELDNIGDRVKGFWQADIMLRQALDAQGPLEALLMKSAPLRTNLLKAAEYLWSDDPGLCGIVADIRSGHSHVNKADDLRSMAALFAEHWEQVENRCDVTKEDVVRADDLSARILEIMDTAGNAEISDLKRTRDTCSEYARRGIEDIRAAAAFAYRKDQERLNRYPTFALGKKKKKTNGKNEEEAQALEENPEQAVEPAFQA
jgi:hypothetical protein